MKTPIRYGSSWLFWLALLPILTFRFALAQSSINAGNRWAWGASTGWINCRADSTNGAVVGEYVCSGYLYAPSTGWISVGSGNPTNGIRYHNAATNDYGVNHDGRGNLRGYAWSDSIGWIAFEPIGAPRIDLCSGVLDGYAWSASMGWIAFSNMAYYVQSDYLNSGPDGDSDGIPDSWERDMTGGKTNQLSFDGDYDGDGVSDGLEYASGTDPTVKGELLEVTGMSIQGGSNAWITWRSKPTRTYRLQTHTNLLGSNGWVDSGLGLLSVGSNTESTQCLYGISGSQTFYRVKAVVPLSE